MENNIQLQNTLRLNFNHPAWEYVHFHFGSNITEQQKEERRIKNEENCIRNNRLNEINYEQILLTRKIKKLKKIMRGNLSSKNYILLLNEYENKYNSLNNEKWYDIIYYKYKK